MNLKAFEALDELGVSLSPTELARLCSYVESLEHWNRRMNLTALEGDVLVRRLVAEPLWVAEQLKPGGRYLDVGSGNGSPGIPWQIHCAFNAAFLVEARQRRSVFLRHVAHSLGLGAVRVHAARVEECLSDLGPVDWITLQGLRLTLDLFETLSPACESDARIVWFSGGADPPIAPEETLRIPGTDRLAMVFRVSPRTSSGSS